MQFQSANPKPLFLRNRHLLILTLVVSIAAGLFAVRSMQRFEDPRITNLFPIIVTHFPGASAERVETLVTEKIEEELAEVVAIDDTTSTSLAGVSVIAVEISKYVTEDDYREIFAEIRDKLDKASRSFKLTSARARLSAVVIASRRRE